jgi:hypothetical protein
MNTCDGGGVGRDFSQLHPRHPWNCRRPSVPWCPHDLPRKARLRWSSLGVCVGCWAPGRTLQGLGVVAPDQERQFGLGMAQFLPQSARFRSGRRSGLQLCGAVPDDVL